MGRVPVSLNINGRAERLEVAPHRTLLEVIRDDLQLTGTKCGCEDGTCGACTILLNGAPCVPVYCSQRKSGAGLSTIEVWPTARSCTRCRKAFVKSVAINVGSAPRHDSYGEGPIGQEPYSHGKADSGGDLLAIWCRCTAIPKSSNR